MASSAMLQVTGLTPENYNYLKYWFAHTNIGREVFHDIFLWGYKGPHSEIKETLFQIPDYSNKKYRSDFDGSQRLKIENGSIQKFDLSLFYLLLQRVCSLPGPFDREWGKGGDPDKLPAILYQLKMSRNALTHDPRTEISDQQLIAEMDGLKNIFGKALAAAGKEFNISPNDVSLVQDKIVLHLESILNASSSAIDAQIQETTSDDDDGSTEDHLKKLLARCERNIKLAIHDAGKDLEKLGKQVSDDLAVGERDLRKIGDKVAKVFGW